MNMRLKKGGKKLRNSLYTAILHYTQSALLSRQIPSLKNRQDQTVRRRRGRNKLHALSMVYMLCSMGKYIYVG